MNSMNLQHNRRNRIDLKIKLMLLKIRHREIAKECGVSRQLVTMTLNGVRHNKDVIDFVEKLPDPELRRAA